MSLYRGSRAEPPVKVKGQSPRWGSGSKRLSPTFDTIEAVFMEIRWS